MAAVGVAWGVFDSLKADAPAPAAPLPTVPPTSVAPAASPVAPPELPSGVARIVRLAVSAAKADGSLDDAERAVILDHARRAGIAADVDRELQVTRPLADIVRGVSADAERRDLYTLAFAIVRADETVSGAERIYLAQLGHALGLDSATTAQLERQAATAIDGAGPAGQAP
jgi:uncharacterized membrane protein YebE (DUF533 family)